jgi:GntR family transcriptional regulator/MocR family aminotransferase
MHTNIDFVLNFIEKKFDFKQTGQSKYLQISNFFRECIYNNDFPAGNLLPTTRLLAKTLGVSRSTTLKAYEQLQMERLIESKQGSGYRVKDYKKRLPTEKKINTDFQYPEISKKGKLFLKNVSLIHSTTEQFVAFRPGLPPLDVFPVNQWKRLSNLYWRHIKNSSLSFSDSSGIESLKINIANYLNLVRGIKCDYEQIIIVSGSLQSLYLIANALLNPKDTVVMENPTFPNVHSIFRSLGANIKPVSVDDSGIEINNLKLSNEEKPKVIHITPSNHYPTGAQMSLERKQEVLKWANQNEAVIIENDYDHEISNWKNRQESLFSLDKQERTIFLGTFNRLLHQSVRLGYMVVPYFLLDVIKALQKHSHRFVSPSNQLVMSQFIEKNYLYNHIKNVVDGAEKRKSIFIENFKKHMHPSIKILPSQARSLHLLTEIPSHLSDKEIKEKLNELNITAHDYSKCFLNDSKQGLIFGYSCVKRPLIIKTIKELAKVYNKIVASQ